MPGNEKQILSFLLNKKNINLKLKHLGKIDTIKVPHKNKLIAINLGNLDEFFPDDSSKKADVFINDLGCSLKQKGGNFSYNRLQRKNLTNFFCEFIDDTKIVEKIILKIDQKIKLFHAGKIIRNFKFLDVMSENEFKDVLRYLMTEGSPNLGKSNFSVKYIIEANKNIKTVDDLLINTFDEYFMNKKNSISFAIRRHWIGQKSKSENGRAKSLFKSPKNKPWCFNKTVGTPKSGWDLNVAEKDRKTAYTLSIEQK